jgi:hypothetical protein
MFLNQLCLVHKFLVFLFLQQLSEFFRPSGLNLHINHWHTFEQVISNRFPRLDLGVLVAHNMGLLEENGNLTALPL